MQLDPVAMDLELLSQILPLGDTAVTAVVTIFTAIFTYAAGRRKSNQEVQNMQAEKRSIEAASNVSIAESAQIISAAATATVQPLVERLREQREEIKCLKFTIAKLKAENEILRNGRE